MTNAADRKPDERSVHILARTLVRDLRASGLDERDLIAFAAELVDLVADHKAARRVHTRTRVA